MSIQKHHIQNQANHGEANKMIATPSATTQRLYKSIGIILLAASSILTGGTALAASSDYDALPPTIQNSSANTDPLVMLAMSNDHQLFVKAYTDYTDLDGNGTIDTTYIDTFDYYGYFDSNRCYSHASGKFTPQEAASGANSHHCSTASRWSGNFLNWATMTRMDVLRKVLFGGARSTDTTSATVLERVQIPTDVHAFVKTFSTATTTDMQLYTPYAQTAISMCNTTRTTGLSHAAVAVAAPPLLRVANGSWPGWSSNERTQCLYRDENSGGLGIEPPATNRVVDLTVRVDVCVASKLESNCKQYTSGAPKPTGLLQKFGERDSSPIRFGLMTGSYSKNMSGGVLRKDISNMSGNTTSSLDEINSTTGQFINQGSTDKGIINTISRFRIANYNFNSPYIYTDCNSPGILTITEGNASTGCSAWGNPMGEIYMEALRYFSGQTAPTAAFNTSDAAYVPSLPQTNTWTDPMDNSNYCANCSVVVISTGLNSFDTNQMSSAADIPGLSGAADVNTKTNTVGSNEGINGNTYIIGEATSSTNQQCTSKTVNNFSDAKGVCPEMPTLKGGFQIAGLAHHAYITDLRPNNVTYPDVQNVDTYAISLAESLPSFSIPVDGKTVTFSPHCEANSSGGSAITDGGWRICSLADVTIESLAADQSTGSMLFAWEDSTWGFDYDMDGVERITWCVGSACSPSISSDQIKFTASTELTAAGHAMLFGYTVSGTTADGVKRHVLRPGGQNFNVLYSPFNNAGNQPADVATTYTASAAGAAAQFKNPLWYAAKYGNFNDLNGNNLPDQQAEWDSENNKTGAAGGDGIPDNFFQVTNPATLETQLEKVFTEIVVRTSAGTALAILSTNSSGTGAIYQSLYDPEVVVGTKTITWGGRVHALFVDNMGLLREDSDSSGTKGTLDNYSTDNIVEIFYSDIDKRTKIRRYTSITNYNNGTFTEAELSTLQPIWNARDELAKLDDATIDQQRAYATAVSSSANEGRHILTWIDSDTDGAIDGGEFTDFTTSAFNTDFGLLNGADQTEANNIINYIRGKEISGFRSRTIDFDGDSIDEVWRLGDIINASPAVVAAPAAAYDIIHNDPTYTTFANQYSNRREVLYVGANDGMLHAFNSGFFNPATKTYSTSSGSAAAHPLGAEMWAYVPFNLLPHLKWLTETNYPHVYYMDGKPRVFDVNIFADDADHPGGWGTILVAGMRFGGGNLSYDHDNNAGTADITTRSAYVVFDVTNPEVAPKLLAEITDPNLGFTTSVPTIAVQRVPGPGNDWSNPATNNWYLVFGSGPNDLDTATSTQSGRIYVYDLKLGTFQSVTQTPPGNSFIGDPKSVDWEADFSDDVVYFGTIGGTEAAPTGQLMRLLVNTMETNVMLNSAQPFVAAPIVASDPDFNKWVFTGTGRLFTSNDNASVGQQSYYGIKDVAPYTTLYTIASLQNVTGVQVFADSSVEDPLTVLPASPATDTFTKLVGVINSASGWYKNLTANGTSPSTRSLSTSLMFNELVLFTSYTPPLSNACVTEGTSSLFALYFQTGTASPGVGLGDSATIANALSSPLTVESIELGLGLSSEPTFLPGSGETTSDGKARGIVSTQMGTSAITSTTITGTGSTGGRSSWREIFDF